jgi:hypothetical protein
MAKKTSKSKKKSSKPKAKPKAKAKKVTKSKVKAAAKPKAKKTVKPKAKSKKASGGTARAASQSGTLTISSAFNGQYTSEVEDFTEMNGTLYVPASASNTSQVLYVLDSDPSTNYVVTPAFSGNPANLISFNFAVNGCAYSFSASKWTASNSGSGGEWDGEATDSCNPMAQPGSWNAKT